MTSFGHALARAELIRVLTAYSGITTADGAGDGSTLIDTNLIGRNDFVAGKVILIMSGTARDEDRGALSFVPGTGIITVISPFNTQILAGTAFRIINISSVETLIFGIFHEQVDAVVNITAVNTGETDVLNLAVANTRYIVRSLRLKCADPGANTVTVRLYELVNDVLTEVDSFAITAANFATHHSLMDMFGLPHLAGDQLQVTVRASAGGPYAVTGQYSHGKTNV